MPQPPLLEDRVLSLLPADGTPVLNRVMRVMLTRETGRLVSQDEYFAARDQLFDEGRIGRRRGQGGQVFLIPDAVATPAHPANQSIESSEAWPEAALMKPLERYLEGPFAKGLDVGDGCTLTQDISKLGPSQGKWTRPDYLFVSAMRFKYLPGVQVDVHSFELKAEAGGTVYAVHEALAQTRFTHFGHLVWHLPEGSKAEARLPEIEDQCEAHGIGLIRIREPLSPEAFEILLDPKRKAPPPAMVDGFLEQRLTADHRSKLSAFIKGVGA